MISAENIWLAQAAQREGPLKVVRTPSLLLVNPSHEGSSFFSIGEKYQGLGLSIPAGIVLYAKLENVQNTGSFKIRGVANQMRKITPHTPIVTMSAGNYGRTFAHASQVLGIRGTVIMPETAPDNRAELIKSHGIEVERLPTARLMEGVKLHEDRGATFLHPFDDLDLIAGYGSLGLEIVEDVPDVDIVLVCCGGGGLLAGVAAAIRLCCHKPNVRIYGVEPENANSMERSWQTGQPMKLPSAKSVAAGLAPPFAGENAFVLIKSYCSGIVSVSDEDIKNTVRIVLDNKLVAEPSGVAGLAALLSGKIKVHKNEKVMVVLTGGNVSLDELKTISEED